jgi:hypothetical protein
MATAAIISNTPEISANNWCAPVCHPGGRPTINSFEIKQSIANAIMPVAKIIRPGFSSVFIGYKRFDYLLEKNGLMIM